MKKPSKDQIKKLLILGAVGVVVGSAATGIAACSSDADVASHNISQDADNFKIYRRIVAINGITDKYILSIEGWCNITAEPTQLEVVCKVGTEYKKHIVGLSDNVTYLVEQINPVKVDPKRYKVIFKPEAIVPEVEAR